MSLLLAFVPVLQTISSFSRFANIANASLKPDSGKYSCHAGDLDIPPMLTSRNPPDDRQRQFLQESFLCKRTSTDASGEAVKLIFFSAFFWEKAHILEAVFKEKNKTPDLGFYQEVRGNIEGVW